MPLFAPWGKKKATGTSVQIACEYLGLFLFADPVLDILR